MLIWAMLRFITAVVVLLLISWLCWWGCVNRNWKIERIADA